MSTHDTLERLAMNFVFLPTDMICAKCSLQNFYLIPTIVHVLAQVNYYFSAIA